MWGFLAFAVAGLLASAAVHVSTFLGADPQEWFPPVWLLHIGIFVAFIPAITAANLAAKAEPGDAGGGGSGSGSGGGGGGGSKDQDPWNRLLGHAPAWVRIGLGVLFAYAIVNFAVFMTRAGGSPTREPNGTFTLREKGKPARVISADEYHHHRARQARGFSGHWMVFYAASAAALFASIRRRRFIAALPLPAPPVSATGPAPVIPLAYATEAPRLPLWLHASLRLLCQGVGFLGMPIFAALVLLPRLANAPPGLRFLATPVLLFGGAAAGICLPGFVFRRIPARCPACGGRAFGEPDNHHYTCADCGHRQRVG